MGGIPARITAPWVRWRGSSPALPRLVPERAGEAVMQASAVQVWPILTTKRRMESATTFIHHRSITGNRPPYCLHGRFFLFRECPCCLSSPTAHFRTCTHWACALMRGKIESRAVFADIDVGGPEASASQWWCCEPCMAHHHPLPRKCSGTSLDSHVVPETCRHSPPPNSGSPHHERIHHAQVQPRATQRMATAIFCCMHTLRRRCSCHVLYALRQRIVYVPWRGEVYFCIICVSYSVF